MKGLLEYWQERITLVPEWQACSHSFPLGATACPLFFLLPALLCSSLFPPPCLCSLPLFPSLSHLLVHSPNSHSPAVTLYLPHSATYSICSFPGLCSLSLFPTPGHLLLVHSSYSQPQFLSWYYSPDLAAALYLGFPFIISVCFCCSWAPWFGLSPYSLKPPPLQSAFPKGSLTMSMEYYVLLWTLERKWRQDFGCLPWSVCLWILCNGFLH